MFFQTVINVLPFLIIPAALFWFWMVYDCFVHEPPSEKRIIWLIVIIVTHFIGALLYYFMRRPERLRTTKQ